MTEEGNTSRYVRFKKYIATAMKCPHLLMAVSCEAPTGPYVPSLFELEEYCRTGSHIKCPLFRMRPQSGRE